MDLIEEVVVLHLLANLISKCVLGLARISELTTVKLVVTDVCRTRQVITCECEQ